MIKPEDGTLSDIPAAVTSELTELGWMSADSTRNPDSIPESVPNEGIIPGSIGVSRTTANSAYQDKRGVRLTAKNITPAGLTLVCEQRHQLPSVG